MSYFLYFEYTAHEWNKYQILKFTFNIEVFKDILQSSKKQLRKKSFDSYWVKEIWAKVMLVTTRDNIFKHKHTLK